MESTYLVPSLSRNCKLVIGRLLSTAKTILSSLRSCRSADPNVEDKAENVDEGARGGSADVERFEGIGLVISAPNRLPEPEKDPAGGAG